MYVAGRAGLQFTHIAGALASYHAGVIIKSMLFGSTSKATMHTSHSWTTYTMDPKLVQQVSVAKAHALQKYESKRLTDHHQVLYDLQHDDYLIAEHKNKGLIKVMMVIKGKLVEVSIPLLDLKLAN
jgi:hypothetical protein